MQASALIQARRSPKLGKTMFVHGLVELRQSSFFTMEYLSILTAARLRCNLIYPWPVVRIGISDWRKKAQYPIKQRPTVVIQFEKLKSVLSVPFGSEGCLPSGPVCRLLVRVALPQKAMLSLMAANKAFGTEPRLVGVL